MAGLAALGGYRRIAGAINGRDGGLTCFTPKSSILDNIYLMKLHLPLSLRRSLLNILFATGFAVASYSASGGVMHPDVSFQTYTDYAQNMGRYALGSRENALLKHIRQEEGGYVIRYTNGNEPHIISLEQGLLETSSVDDIGALNAVSPSFIATVLHNGTINASFGTRQVGEEHAINYVGIDIRYSDVFRLAPNDSAGGQYDYMLQRQSKIATEVNWIPTTSVTDMSTLIGTYEYHIGAGSKGVWREEINGYESLAGAYSYIIGGINEITSATTLANTTNITVALDTRYASGLGAGPENPLPNAIRAGDSGSPVFIYNEDTKRYEYIAAQQSGGSTNGYARGNVTWTHDTLESFNERVNMSSTNLVQLNAVTWTGDYYRDKDGNSTTVFYGLATDAAGNVLGEYNALKSGMNTWADLSGIKDLQNWYAYDAVAYLNNKRADYFFNENLVFTATQSQNIIELQDTVDLGVGYVEFNAREAGDASYVIQSAEGESNLLNSAGYVVNEGASVHVRLTNPDDYMYEWRKMGAGDLYIDGTGDTNALLNLGGSGTTYLQQQGGHAAYNVLVNRGARVVVSDPNQIVRDFTFGAGGGVLDMNGNSMDWYCSEDAAGRFTINALTEEAMITNGSSTGVTLTYKEGGATSYLGSFSDSEQGALLIDYQGDGTWTLNGIYTNLTHHDGSGLVVSDGKVVLSGVNTVHGMGSIDGTSANRAVHENDWHYADAAMAVTVKSGATFELGSHARLEGNVMVESGGTFVMHEGVHHRYEYVEGGEILEDTYKYSEFYGLQGDVSLAGSMQVKFEADSTANLTYGGSISGAGALSVDAGLSGGFVRFTGDNSEHTGSKEIVAGGVVAETVAALGNTSEERWLVRGAGFIASGAFVEGYDALAHIDSASTGVLALMSDYATPIDLSTHKGLTIGALAGHTVNYGSEDTELTAYEGANGRYYWVLGGGGGELVVHSLLLGDVDLYLGSDASSTGKVTLTNTGNTFSGEVFFRGTGVILNALEGTLGESHFSVSYGNGLVASYVELLDRVEKASAGVLYVDRIADADIDLSEHAQLSIGASENVTYTGTVLWADGADYRFSAAADAFLVVKNELTGDRNVVVDAQTHSGGKVELRLAEEFGSDVTVQGNNSQTEGGDITLLMGADTRLLGELTLGAGGSFDLNGHIITLTQSVRGEGGALLDSTGRGELVMDASSGDLSLSGELNITTLRKIGQNDLELGTSGTVGSVYVQAGSLTLGGASVLSSDSTVHLADGALLNLGYETQAAISVDSPGASAEVHQSGSGLRRLASLQLAEGATARLTGDSGYTFWDESYGGASATLTVETANLDLNSQQSIDIDGTLSLTAEAVTLRSRGSADDMQRNIEHLHVGGGVLTVWEESWNTIWNIGALTGAGTLQWNSNTTHDTTSRMVLMGDGDFTGTITLNRDFRSDSRTHGAFIELASDYAARNADIILDGAGANAVASLALNTANAHIKGLAGNEHSFVYAGVSLAEAALSGNARPATSRSAVLSVDTGADKSFTYAGTIGNAGDTLEQGISLVKTGAGAQHFTGTVSLNDVTVTEGTLSFAADTLTLRGDVSLAYGSSLSMGDFSLEETRAFAVAAGAAGAEGSADFAGVLTLAGGSFVFDGAAVNSAYGQSEAALALNGVQMQGESQVISFTNAGALRANRTYVLSTGDWTGIRDKITLQGLDYYSASLSTNESGHLLLTLNMLDNSLLWDGTAERTEWSSDYFGSSERNIGSANVLFFDDAAGSRNVLVTGDSSAQQAVFASSEDYFVSSANGVATVGSLAQIGAGTTTLDGGVLVTGETQISSGALRMTATGQLQGHVGGDGTLVIDWGADVSGYYTLRDLGTLHLVSGSFGSSKVGYGAMGVEHIIVERGATYVQADNVTYSGHITARGGVLQLAGGGINGELSLAADTELYIRSGDVNLHSAIDWNGFSLEQTGNNNARVHIGGEAALENYTVKNGELWFDAQKVHRAGTLVVESGARLVMTHNASLEASQILLRGGSLLMRNGGGNNNSISADILVDESAIIGGASNGSLADVNGTISGTGVLTFVSYPDAASANKFVVNSLISDAASPLALVVDGAKVNLAAANTYTGGTTINSGTLTVAQARALGTGDVAVNGGTLALETDFAVGKLRGSGGSINVNAHALEINDAVYAGSITGTGALIKAGSAQAELSGEVTMSSLAVQSGSLLVSGSLDVAEPIQVLPGAVLTLAGEVTYHSAIQNAGVVNLSEGCVFDLDVRSGVNGYFSLITGAGSISGAELSAANFLLQGSSLGGVTCVISQTGSDLGVTLSGFGRELSWSGQAGGTWDTESGNWLTQEGETTAFRMLDVLHFGAEAETTTLNVECTVIASSLTVDGGDYRFTGIPIEVQDAVSVAAGASAAFESGLQIDGGLSLAGRLSMAVNQNQSLNLTSSGGSLTKTGSGTLSLVSDAQSLGFESVTVGGGGLRVEVATTADSVELDSETELALVHEKGDSVLGSVQGAGATLSKSGAGNLEIAGATVDTMTLKGGGETRLTGTVETQHLSLGLGSVVLENGASVTATRLTAGNTANNQATRITVEEGAALTVTGDNMRDDTDSDMLLAHWKSCATVLQLTGGELNVENTYVLMGWDTGGTLQADAGTANLLGIRFSSNRGNSDALRLGSAAEGSAVINIGSYGIQNIGASDFVELGRGTIRATADWTATASSSESGSGAITLVSKDYGTVIDTNGYSVSIDSALAGDGLLRKTGDGVLNVNGDVSAYTGIVDVAGGSLVATANLAHIRLSSGGSLVGTPSLNEGMELIANGGMVDGNLVLNGGVLSFSEEIMNSGAPMLTVADGYTISFAEGVSQQIISIENVMDIQSGDYHLVDGTFAEGISGAQFSLGGISSFVMAEIDVRENGLWLGLTAYEGGLQIWTGTNESHTWSTTVFGSEENKGVSTLLFTDAAENRNVVLAESVDAAALVFENSQAYNINYSNVNSVLSIDSLELKGSGSVRVNAALDVTGATIAVDKGTLELNGTATLDDAASITLTNGGVLNICSSTQTLHNLSMDATSGVIDIGGGGVLHLHDYSGAGSIGVGTVHTYGNVGFVAGAGLKSLLVQQGHTTLSGELAPEHITLATGTQLSLDSALNLGAGTLLTVQGAAALNADLVLAGGTMHVALTEQNGNASFTVNGTVSGSGGCLFNGGGTLTFANNVDLGSFTQADNAATNFNAVTTLNTLNVSGGTVNIVGTTTVNNLNATGSGTVNVAGTGVLTIHTDSMTLNPASLELAEGATLNLERGAYQLVDGNILSNDKAIINFSGTSMKAAGGATNTTFNGTFNVLSDATLDVSTKNDGILHGPNISGVMNISEGKTLTVTGESVGTRLQINEGAVLLLQNGATVNRTDNGAFYVKGSLATAENADATFRSRDDIHLNYINASKGLEDTGGSIDVADGASLVLDINKMTSYGKAELNVGRNASLDLTGTNNVSLGSDTTMNLGKGGSIAFSKVEFSNRGAADNATVKGALASYVLTNGHVKSTAEADATIGQQLVNSSVENAGGGTLTVSNSANTITSLEATSGNVKLSENMEVQSLSAASGKTVTVVAGKNIAMAGGVSLGTNGGDATLAARSDYSLARLMEGASFTIRDMSLTNTTLTAAIGAAPVKLQNVTASNVVLSQGRFTMQGATPTVGMGATGNSMLTYVEGVSGIINGATLTLVADPSIPMGGATAMVDLEFVFTGFSTETAYAAGSLAGLESAYGIKFGGLLGELLQVATESVAAADTLSAGESISHAAAASCTVSYGAGTGSNVGSLVITISGLSVPEPATATLSLLALAALAVRRRRKV